MVLDILDEVKSEVMDRISRNEMFTAYDITRSVRHKVGRAVNVAHGDVKQEVHNLFLNNEMPNYARTLGNLPQAPVQPFIYHEANSDPSQYPGNTYAGVMPSIPAAITSTPTVVPDDGVNVTTDGNYKVDARGTLCLPKALLQAVSLQPSDNGLVFADPFNGTVVVVKNNTDVASHCTPLTSYTVDAYGNVRITQAILQSAGLGGSEYEITGNSIGVTVKKMV